MFNAAEIETFALAGKATLTFKSERTEAHYTFRISASDDRKMHFVSVLTGTDNENDFTYAGIIGRDKAFRLTAKSKFSDDAVCVRAFRWVWDAVRAGNLPKCCAINHDGACGRCGRTLTTPQSVETGIGPECARHMGMVPQRVRRPRKAAAAEVISLADRRPQQAGPAWLAP